MSTLYLAAELACACFVGMVVAIVTVSAIECQRIESEQVQIRTSPESLPPPVVFFIEVRYAYIYARADSDAAWMLTSGHHVYHVN